MKKYKLGDIAILNASIIDKKKNIEIEYLDTSSILEGHILGTQKIYLSEAPSRAQRKVKNKTIIYSLVRPNQNHYGILYNTPDNFIVSTGFATIDLKEEFKETIDADFLFLLLTQKQITHHLHRIAENSASAYPSLIPSDIAKLELNFPSIKKQKNIARLIQNINQKIELNRSINHNLEAMAKQLYDYWFLQFDFPDENGKPYKSSGGKMVWNEKLKREIPEGWEVSRLGNICSFRNGINYAKDEIGNSYSIVNVRNISATSILLDSEDFDVITIPSSKAQNYMLTEKDIVIARSGCPGATRLLQTPNNTLFCGFIICCTPFVDNLRVYLTFLLKSFEGTSATTSGGSILQNVSQETLKSLLVVIPSMTQLVHFDKFLSDIIEQLYSNSKTIKNLTTLRDSLLPLLMNGQASLQNCD